MSAIMTHPLDHIRRQKEAMDTSELAQYLAPGIRPDDLKHLADMGMPADSLRALLFALQGVPGPDMPSGGD